MLKKWKQFRPTGSRLIAAGMLMLSMIAAPAPAAMSLLKREMFATTGQLTPESPGAFDEVIGTFHQRAGGPHLPHTPPASADLQGAQGVGIFDLEDAAPSKVMVGAWFFIKTVGEGQTFLLSLGDRAGNTGPMISIPNGVVGAGVPFVRWTPCPIKLTNRWVYLGIGMSHRGGAKADVKFYYKLPGEPLTTWAEFSDGNVWINTVDWCRVSYEANPPGFEYRVGAPSVYTFEQTDFADVEYPDDLVEPIRGMTWYCNPATGNDANDGTAPERAWATAAKINSESLHTGLFSAGSYAEGDTLVIDTSAAELDVPGTTLIFRTEGLNVRAAAGETWIRIKSYRTLAPSGWSTTSRPNVFATSDTAASVVVWEDDKFMHHPLGETFGDVANALSGTPGSFWTDGSTLYVHPFDSTDPRTDGKQYDRSYAYGNMAVGLAAPNMHVRDIHAGKTCLAWKSANLTLQNYCLGTLSVAGNTRIEHCYLYYGSNHNLGLVQGAVGDSIVIEDVQAEQGSPYVGAGGQTVFVSFVGGPSDMGIVHSYRNCLTRANCGLVGSANGTMRQDIPVFYCHNTSGSNQFAKFEFIDCDFGTGNLQGDAVKKVILEGTQCGGLAFGANVELDRCLLTAMPTNPPAYSFTARNCLFILSGVLNKSLVAGTVDMRACTFDARGVTSIQGGVPEAALLTRNGPLTLTFQNNAVMMPAGSVKANVFANFQVTDALDLQCNAYQLSGSVLSYRFNDGSATANRSLAGWQALGYDAGSFSSADLELDNYQPQPGSPLVDAGNDLGATADYSGNVRPVRNDIGATEAPNTFAYWQAQRFSKEELEQPEISGPEGIPGSDGLNNLVKFAFGLEPGQDGTRLLPQIGATGGQLSLTYERLRDAEEVHYEVEESADLRTWMTATLANEEILGEQTKTEKVRASVLTTAGAYKFLRLRVWLD